MFRCGVTGRLSMPGEKCNKIVVESRERVYTDRDGNVIGRGFEIVKEINATDAGLAAWKEMSRG